uniref:Uncharacterized protein n=1 Tax=Anguilla anguilla TaxID=7936 RepID=A0A0E9RPK7_ANGAN
MFPNQQLSADKSWSLTCLSNGRCVG